MDHVYMDGAGQKWPAIIDGRTTRKRGRYEYAVFAVFAPMPSMRGNVRLVGDETKLKPNTATKAKK